MKGFGTVVTGSLSGGSFSVGDEIEFQPANIRGRIRGLQSYGENVATALPGNRVAVNVAGIERSLVERGNILILPGQIVPTVLVDVYFQHLADASRILAHNSEVKFFSGAAQSIGHIRLLGDESLTPGSTGWLQIRLEQPLALSRNDHFVLRLPSPSETIGGGIVVNPHPQMRWRRFQPDVIQQLELQMRGTSSERVVEAASGVESVSNKELQRLGITDAEIAKSITDAMAVGKLRELPDGSYWSTRAVDRESQRLLSTLGLFHQDNPLRLGIPREELRVRLGLSQGMFNVLLDLNKEVISDRQIARLSSHQIIFNDQQERLVALLNAKISASPYSPPSFSETSQLVGQDVAYALIEQGELVLIMSDVVLSKSAYENMLQAVLEILETKGNVSASEVRDRFGTSRKYAIALLEYLDSNFITRRVGDVRVKGSRNP
jgi:selenocysteine-specific elongation factor